MQVKWTPQYELLAVSKLALARIKEANAESPSFCELYRFKELTELLEMAINNIEQAVQEERRK